MGKGTLLVVDGLPGRLSTAKALLRDSEFGVLIASDMDALLNVDWMEEPDLIVSPLHSAVVDGIELARAISNHPRLNTVPVLLVSEAGVALERLIAALKAGADDCLRPPYSPELLKAKVSRMIERKRTGDALLRRKDSYLEETQRLSHVGSFEYDAGNGRWKWSDELFRIVGMYPAAVDAIEVFISRHLGGDFVREILERGARERSPLTREVPIHGQDGSVRVLEITGQVAGGQPTNALRVIGTVRDITEKKHRENALRTSQNQTLQSQKMEALGHLAGGVAHDFNNLLTVMIGYSELISQKLDSESPLLSYAADVRSAGERASALTRQLLAFSRRQILEPRILNLNAIIDNLARMLSRIIGENIELRTNLEQDLGNVEIDSGQVEQVLMNLAVNSRDAMPEGGKLTIETQNVTLDEEYASAHFDAKPGNYVVMVVSDTGCGMDEETKARIFEPFFTTKALGKGTGLGLSTVYGIIKQSRGSIWVYSEPARGTTFKIYLPRTMQCADQTPVEAEAEVSPAGDETILLVEDEGNLRNFISEILRGYGYRVLVADSGLSAIQLVEQQEDPVHLLLTDVVMPEMDGHALSERLIKVRPSLKVLYMSGHTPDTTAYFAVMEHRSHFIQKPFSPAALAKKIREVLDR